VQVSISGPIRPVQTPVQAAVAQAVAVVYTHRGERMFDLDKFEIEVPCPRCGFYEPVTLKQVRLDDVVICRGCKVNLQLFDQMHQVANARRQLAAAMQRLADAFAKPINIKLEF